MGGFFWLYETIEAPGSHAIPGTIDRGPARGRQVALTFDDGPDARVTPGVLRALEARGAKATFFVVGDAVTRHPEIVRRAVADGDEIENHTQTHAHLDWLASSSQVRSEIVAARDAIALVTLRQPVFLRPPFGRRNAQVIEVADDLYTGVVTWTIEPPRGRRVADAVRETVDRVTGGAIILLHDGNRGTDEPGGYTDEAALTGPLVDALRARGFTLVCLNELLS